MTHVHLIGIGGSGLSAIARLLLESGYTVSGSDQLLSPLARQLARDGAQVYEGHAAANIRGADLVVRSSAVSDDNPEVQAALAAGVAVVKRSDYLGSLMEQQTGVAVAGTHGKTTTTAMVAWMLQRLGLDPSYIIGGVSKDLGGNAHAGKGAYFVIEADEYDRMFLGLRPNLAVVTNAQHDHPDCFPTPQEYRQAFVDFVQRLKPGGTLLAYAGEPGSRALAQNVPAGCCALLYGRQEELDASGGYYLTGLQMGGRGGFEFEAWRVENGRAQKLAALQLQVPGEHNAFNALAALAAADRLGLDLDAAARALEQFNGTQRRFDIQGEVRGVTVIDDYAHHPVEIRTTLAAARSRYPGRRIWAVWQPHTYSRTQALANEFAACFEHADRVLVTEVYPSREKPQPYSSMRVVEQMRRPGVLFTNSLNETIRVLLDNVTSGDVVLVMSAGDADQVSAALLAGLRRRGAGSGGGSHAG